MASQSAQAQMRRDRLLATQKLFEMAGKGGPFPTPDARPGTSGMPQYAAQDRPVVDIGNMPGGYLTQGQPQYANLMNIRNRLAPRYFRR